MKPCHVSTWGSPKKHLDYFLRSCRMNGLHPQNADPENWPGADWTEIDWSKKTKAQQQFLADHRNTYTHWLFTDSYDIICAAGWEEIIAKFEAFKSPIVFASESHPWPKVEQAALYPDTGDRCRYLNAGLWMATTEAAEMFLEDIAAIAAKREQCDQGICVDAFLQQRHPIVLDTKCSLCFCMNMNSPEFLDCTGQRPRTKDTGEEPVFFHGNGASDLTPVIQCLKL